MGFAPRFLSSSRTQCLGLYWELCTSSIDECRGGGGTDFLPFPLSQARTKRNGGRAVHAMYPGSIKGASGRVVGVDADVFCGYVGGEKSCRRSATMQHEAYITGRPCQFCVCFFFIK